jgi:hypothetical protein
MYVRCCLTLWLFSGVACHGADLQEIIRGGTATIQSDWAADPDYAYVETDEGQENGKPTSKTYQVVTIEGSDYDLPIAVDGEPLSADRKRAELEKLRSEVQRRKSESASARRERIEAYKKKEDENGALLLDFPNAFTFELEREETMNGYPAYVLSATPRKRPGPLSRAAKVLSGMRGELWLDKEHFHVIRAQCNVVNTVPIYGILAQVMPGTHVELGMTPVSESTWLIGDLSMTLKVSKFFLFRSMQMTRSTYSEYHPNAEVLEKLLQEANDPL